MNVIIVALIVCSLMTPVSVLGAWLTFKIREEIEEEIDKEELSFKEFVNLIMKEESKDEKDIL